VDPLVYRWWGCGRWLNYCILPDLVNKNTLLCQRNEVNFERIYNKFLYSVILWGRNAAMSQKNFSYASGVERDKIRTCDVYTDVQIRRRTLFCVSRHYLKCTTKNLGILPFQDTWKQDRNSNVSPLIAASVVKFDWD
jgi:hypothetical protein